MQKFLLPVHIVFHDFNLEFVLGPPLKKLTSTLLNESCLRIGLIKAGLVLDELYTPQKLAGIVKSTPALPIKYNLDLKEIFGRILMDYEHLAQQDHVFDPEIVLFTSIEPTNHIEWDKLLSQIGTYHPTIRVNWILGPNTDSNQKMMIHNKLGRLFPAEKGCNHRLVESSLATKLDLLLSQEIGELEKRVSSKQPTLMKRNFEREKPNATEPGLHSFFPFVRKPKDAAQQAEPTGSLPGEKTNREPANNPPTLPAQIIQVPVIVPPPASPSSPQAVQNQAPIPSSTADQRKPDPSIANPGQPAKWLDIPPVDQTDRVPDQVKASKKSLGWTLVGASTRGKLHKHEGTYREDAFDFEILKDCILVAVADGAGSHKLSRVGSNLAVKAAISAMHKEANQDPLTDSVVRNALQAGLIKAWEAIQNEAQNRSKDGITDKDLSTTLLLLVYSPEKNLVGVAQVGDGLLAAVLRDGKIVLLGKPETGEYSGLTTFLPNHKVEDLPGHVEVPPLPDAVRMFFVMTDGVADDLFPPQERLPGLVKPLPGVIASADPEAALLELISYDRPGSFDDRTLVVGCQPELRITEPQPPADRPGLAVF